MVWFPDSERGWEGEVEPTVTARAEILGRTVERSGGSIGKLKLADRPQVVASIQPLDRMVGPSEQWTLSVKRGETASARVVLHRQEGFEKEVKFGNETAGRNAAHGVYVDNIGLNGLLAPESMTQREFFITADPVAALGKRAFFLTAAIDGGVTTYPILVEVTP